MKPLALAFLLVRPLRAHAQVKRVSLDDPITRYLPEGAPRWNGITIRHLLTHTGGTTDYPPKFDFRRDYTEAELVKRAAAIPLAFTPGAKWSYSNIGSLLLGVPIHRVTGVFYGDFLKKNIFDPLEMATTRIISEADIVRTAPPATGSSRAS